MRASKDPNRNDENNNFDENYKKCLSAMTRTSKDLNENDKNHDFDENYKKLLSAMEWVVRASKDPNENVENQDFDNKNYKKKISECNDMKGDRVELLERKRRKGQLWPKKLHKIVKCKWNEGHDR